MIFVVGGKGRLGQAIQHAYPTTPVTSLERQVYQDWHVNGAQDKIARFFDAAPTQSTLYITAGLLDPKLPLEDHLSINYRLPKQLIEGATKAGLTVITFGTIMELLIKNKNPYITSKTMLGDYVANISNINPQVAHIRIHTFYGVGKPVPFMFLGQIYHALQNNCPFKMSSGEQLREYHHIEDDIHAIRLLLEANTRGVIELSHGNPLSLRDIAGFIFKAFNREKLLCVGALNIPIEENCTTVFQRHALLKKVNFRETLPEVVNYLQSCFKE